MRPHILRAPSLNHTTPTTRSRLLGFVHGMARLRPLRRASGRVPLRCRLLACQLPMVSCRCPLSCANAPAVRQSNLRGALLATVNALLTLQRHIAPLRPHILDVTATKRRTAPSARTPSEARERVTVPSTLRHATPRRQSGAWSLRPAGIGMVWAGRAP